MTKQDLIDQKLLAARQHPTLDLTLYCYTKKAFYDSNWPNELKKCRGVSFNSNGDQVSFPFDKIFNIGEQWETQDIIITTGLRTRPYELLEKSNGHLCIVFRYKGEWLVHTKGSWVMEFSERDRELLDNMGVLDKLEQHEECHVMTFCFEIIADYDKHTTYEIARAKYGRDTAVLLGIGTSQNIIFNHEMLCKAADTIGCDVIEKYNFDGECLKEWYDHTDTEGYIIHFLDDGMRVKVKTNWYLNERYKKEFVNGTKIIKLFQKYGLSEQSFTEIPEEFHHKLYAIAQAFNDYTSAWERENDFTEILMNVSGTQEEKCRQIAKMDLPSKLKSVLFSTIRGKRVDSHKLFVDDFVESFSLDSVVRAQDMF